VQASSEHSVCFAVRAADGDRARAVLRRKFVDAIRAGRIHDVELVKDCAILAAVGQRMAANKGVAAKLFDAMAQAGVNIKAMAQGSSEYNITVLVAQVKIVAYVLCPVLLAKPERACILGYTSRTMLELMGMNIMSKRVTAFSLYQNIGFFVM
jgi:hypothetical protein